MFFALEIPSQDKAAIVQWRELTFGKFAKSIAAENLHMTMCFIGDASSQQEQQLVELTEQLKTHVVNMDFTYLGVFSKPGVLYIAPSEDSIAATDLAAQLKKIASTLSIRTDKRRFSPHVSLFRKVKHLPEIQHMPVFKVAFSHLVLYKSILGAEGVVYHQVASWSLSADTLN